MKVEFGSGNIMVTSCGNEYESYILFEMNAGSGIVGFINEDRIGKPVSNLHELIDSDEDIVFSFSNIVSCEVVVEAGLQNIKAMLENHNERSSNEIYESIKKLMKEIEELSKEN